MNVLLTGAAGFLGRSCIEALSGAGHRVVTTDRVGSVDLKGDLADSRFTATLPPADAIVHAAAVQYVSADLPLWKREEYFSRNNVVATGNLVARYKGEESVYFLNVATSMMYLQNGSPLYSPDSPMQGQGVYSISKLAAQRSVEAAFRNWGAIVPCIIGGPGREGLFRNFVQSIQRSGRAYVPGSGRHPTHMVHVDDVAALIEIAVRNRSSGYLNAGAPEPLSINQWVELIGNELGVPVRSLHLPLWPVEVLARWSGYRLLAREQLLMLAQPHVLDISRPLALGWRPRHDSAKIVRDIARYIVSTRAPAGAAR